MSTGPRGTADDLPTTAPADRLGAVHGSVSPAERPSSHPSPAPPTEDEPLIASHEPEMRVTALVMAAGLVGFSGWVVVESWKLLVDVLDGRIPRNVATPIWSLLIVVVFLLPFIRRLWLVARRGVDPEDKREGTDAVESRAFLEAVERHDRLLDASRRHGDDGTRSDAGLEVIAEAA